jgi:hypothetical protein
VETETFTGDTLDDARVQKDRWLSKNKVRVVKEWPPVVLRRPAGPYRKPEEGEVESVTIAIEYEGC